MALNPIVAAVTDRIIERSKPTRRRYLTLMGLSRSEEHTSELQSQSNLVCRLLLEKKKKKNYEAHAKNKTKHHYSHQRNTPHQYWVPFERRTSRLPRATTTSHI